MNDPNRLMKWLFLVVLPVVLALVILIPPSEKLKGGIDLVGGTSLLYEIDTSGLSPVEKANLSTRVMNILKERVDPRGQLNLEWRPVGNTRIEIRMPHPPKEAIERRNIYFAARDRIQDRSIRAIDVELALNAPNDQRDAFLADLVRGVDKRTTLIEAVKAAFNERKEVMERGDDEASAAALAAYQTALAQLVDTALPIARLTDILALEAGEKRNQELAKLRAEFPAYDAGKVGDEDGALLTKAIEAHDQWVEHKGDLEDPADLKRRLRGAGVLEFRILADRDPSSPTMTKDAAAPRLCQPAEKYIGQLAKFGPRPQAGDDFVWYPIADLKAFMRLDDLSDFESVKDDPLRPIVEEYAGRYYALMHDGSEYKMLKRSEKGKWELQSAYADRDYASGQPVVSFQLDWAGGRLFSKLTGDNVDRQLCIMLDATAMSHANINERIGARCQISGGFTPEKVQNLVRILEAGSLPARLKETPLMEKTIGPSLGRANREAGMNAAMWGAITVALFVLVYYGIAAGGMANIALALNLLFVLGIMALMQATFTLPGIAGLILTVGMAIDANVLIFERIREERTRGVIFKKALNVGYDKAFSTIMDANLTTLITCVILGFVGSEEVKGFAIVLGIGIAMSMFTALFVTRLVFNTLIAQGWLKDLRMFRIIGVPTIDWLALRRIFWPISIVVASAGLALFVGRASVDKESIFDIEFLGGTSVQIDLKPDVQMNDDEVRQRITASGGEELSAVNWLKSAADQLEEAQVAGGDTPTQFSLTSNELSGEQLGVLMRHALGDILERDGIHASGRTALFDGKAGKLDRQTFEEAVKLASAETKKAAANLGGARVQTVGSLIKEEDVGPSFEVVTVESNREVVQAAILAAMGNLLSVQRGVGFTAVRDEVLTKEPYFVVEADDHLLSQVIGGNAEFDVRRFRGGVAVHVVLDAEEDPLPVSKLERRLREVGLQPEFEEYQTRDAAIYPLGASTQLADNITGYKEFAVLASDESLLFQDDESLWAEQLASTQLAQVEAALAREKSLSKVVQFLPQVAGQTQNRAIFAIVLALGAIVAYVWLRFGTKEFGLAAIVALVHDVSITLGLVAGSHFVFNTFFGRALAIDEFRIDLPMVAALLTVIGYSLNDTIVVFDRIRENRGKSGVLAAGVINTSINQTLARTLLTSFTTFLVVAILYAFGGKGVHGFAFALVWGVIVGTYSSIGIATPLLYRPRVLKVVIAVIVSLGLIGVVLAAAASSPVRLVLCGVIIIGFGWTVTRIARENGSQVALRSATA